jgi:polyisoprenoid-binding protein YceI
VKFRKALVYRTAVACTGAFLLAAAAGAQDQAPSASIKLDPAKTTVSFSAGTLRHVHGTFALKGGVFAVDSKSGIAQGEILVDAASEKSSDAGLDKKIQGETLETGKYPGIFFHPEKVTGSLPAHDGEQHLKLEGSLNIHGRDHPMTVDVDAVKNGEDYFLKTTFDVPYVKWGMKDASTFFMRDRNVRITVESHGTVEEAVKGS